MTFDPVGYGRAVFTSNGSCTRVQRRIDEVDGPYLVHDELVPLGYLGTNIDLVFPSRILSPSPTGPRERSAIS
jgi:hypothetical protein